MRRWMMLILSKEARSAMRSSLINTLDNFSGRSVLSSSPPWPWASSVIVMRMGRAAAET